MPTFTDILDLYRLPGENVVAQTADYTATHFNQDGIPVLICAYDEEQDLPVTLAALARSSNPVQPFVIDNGSTDRTAEFATRMGATVVEEPRPAKVFALARGLEQVVKSRGLLQALFTDADTVMGQHWSGNLYGRLLAAGEFSAVSGTTSFHSPGEQRSKLAADTLRSAANIGKLYFDTVRREVARGRGTNMGFSFDRPERVDDILNDFDVQQLVGNDTQLMNAMIAHGATTDRATELSSLVLSRGDRMSNVITVLRVLINREYRKNNLYPDWELRVQHADDAQHDIAA